MRILIVTNLYPPHSLGGYEERCRCVVNGLRARGHAVRVLTSSFGVGEAIEEPDADGVVRALTPIGYFGFPWVRAPRLFDLERHNVEVLRRQAAAVNPEIVFCWNMGGIGKSLLLEAAALATLATDISDHWVQRSLPVDPFLRWHQRHALLSRLMPASRRGLRVCAPNRVPLGAAYFTSRALRDHTAAGGFPELADAPVIYCGIDVERFAGASPARPAAGRLRCMYVGRLCADKGVHTACAGVDRAGEGIELDVYGEGDDAYAGELRARFAGHPRIRFRGRVAVSAMPAVYAAHDCVVFPSEWAEPFALVPLEAAASRRLTIGTTTGGSGEFLVEGETALTYVAGDADDLARRLREACADPDRAQALAERAYATVRERFTEPTMIDSIERLLLALVPARAALAQHA